MREAYVFVIPSSGVKVEVIARMIDKIAGGYIILSAIATYDAVHYILVKDQKSDKMKPTKEIIDKAARRGALLQDVQVIMWEFTKKRESDESVDWIEYAKKIIDLVEGKKGV